jgi:hypothetical protein
MPEGNNTAGETIDLGTVRDALRAELTSRGFDVASDTLGLRREIYVIGDNDLAKALFHLDTDAQEAAESIYRSSGSWVDGMPARFAVLPASESLNPSVEMLEQMSTTPLYYETDGRRVTFRHFDTLVTERLDGGSRSATGQA